MDQTILPSQTMIHVEYLIMKWISKLALFGFSLNLFVIFAFNTENAAAQTPNEAYVSYDDFYQDLSSFGQWIEDPQYGYVWSPNVDGSFRPYYTNGYWAMTEYGNTWVSQYQWGWACFHYGRWVYDNYYGWLWIPGSNWGPAWVSWRYGDGFYGWAPLSPDYADGVDYSCPNNWWVFIPPQYLYTGNYYHYWNGPRDNSGILTNTTFVRNMFVNNNVTYLTGPRAREVEAITHQPVQVFHLANSKSFNSRVHDNIVKLYHPMEVKPAATIDGQRATPPNAVGAPQPVRTSQQAKPAGQNTPPFRTNLPKNNGHDDPPGANINETARPDPQQPRRDENPYEYDVNRPVPQPGREPAVQPAPSRQQQQQLQQPQVRQQPTAPQPAQQPAQQQHPPAPSPAPAPARTNAGSGGRR